MITRLLLQGLGWGLKPRGYWDVKMPDRLRKDVWIQFCNLANVELSKYYSPNIQYELMKILLYLSTLEVHI